MGKGKTSSTTVTFHVGYKCKYCAFIFKSTHEFCTHKVESHWDKLSSSRCIVFEESIVEPTKKQLKNFRKALTVVQVQPEFKNLLNNKHGVQKKQIPDDPVFVSETVETSTNLKIDNTVSLLALQYGDSKPGHNSDIKTGLVEGTTVKYEPSQQNEDFIGSHANSVTDPQENEYSRKNVCYNKEEIESNFIEHDANANADADVDSIQPQITHVYQNPLELSDVTQSTKSMSSSFAADTEHEYFPENESDSDDDDPFPSTTSTILKPAGTTTTAGLNNLRLSQFKLECQICSKQFNSSAQLGIHVGICKLYNSGKAVASKGPGPTPALLVFRGREEPQVRKDISSVKCQECFKLIKGSNFKNHMKYHQARAYSKARRKFVCQICGKAFGSKNNLEKHGGVHSDETPNKCTFPGCHFAYKFKSGLLKHSKQHAALV